MKIKILLVIIFLADILFKSFFIFWTNNLDRNDRTNRARAPNPVSGVLLATIDIIRGNANFQGIFQLLPALLLVKL